MVINIFPIMDTLETTSLQAGKISQFITHDYENNTSSKLSNQGNCRKNLFKTASILRFIVHDYISERALNKIRCPMKTFYLN